MLIRIFVFSAIVSLCGPGASACSLIPGAFLQSNFELIDASDAIVVATAVRSKKGEDSFSKSVVFKVNEVLKGSPSKQVNDLRARFGKPTPSNPHDFLSANPEAYMGPCVRMTYRKGDRYVLMLRNDPENGFIVWGDAFSRINEDDFGPNSIWRRAIGIYINIQQNPDRMEQIGELEKLVDRGLREGATEFEQQLGLDALNHLLNIHPDKPTEWLLDRYDDPDYIMRRFKDRIAGTPEEAADNLVSLVFGEGPPPEDERTAILRALAEGDHPQAEPLFYEIISETAPEPTRLGAALAYFIKKGEYDFVKAAFGEHILWVTGVTGPGSGPGFWGVMWQAIRYGENKQVTPEFASWWERQTTSNCLILNGPFDCSFDRDKATALLNAPRKNQTLLLAAASSPEVIAWAEAELDRLHTQGVKTFEEAWDFPMKLLLAAYRGDKPSRVHELACGSKEMREGLADLIGEVPTLYTEELLREMMAIDQHEHVREQLFESAVLIAAADMKESWLGDAELVYAYARTDGTIPLRKRDRRHLPCLK